MKLSYRQGIVRYQTDPTGTVATFLQKSQLDNHYIDLMVTPDPTIITFAHGDSNYTFEETKSVERAWGPFPVTGETQYLYWDIDLVTGALTRGFTPFPLITQAYEPLIKRANQHWFDTSKTEMNVWDVARNAWVVKVRVFAGTYESNAIIIPQPWGVSQVGLNSIDPMVKSGNLLFDRNGDPIRDRLGRFITSEHTLSTQQSNANSSTAFQLEGETKTVTATEFIPGFRLVTLSYGETISLASSTTIDKLVNGMVGEDFYQNQSGRIITSGLVRNEQWNWAPATIGKPLFCGALGEITTTPPTSGVVQVIGNVYDKNTINIQIQIPFVL